MKQEIFGLARFCPIRLNDLKKEQPNIYNTLVTKYNIKPENSTYTIVEKEITDLGISDNYIINSECHFNLNKLKEILISLIGIFPYYLGVSDSRTWENYGYIFSNYVTDIIKYDHDLKLLMEKHSPNKAILLDGYHDNHKYNQPICIIGLTNKEYESLKNEDLKHLTEFAESLF